MEFLKEIPAGTNPVKKARHCSLHSDEEVELYCETCGQLICLSCAENGGEHQNHCYNDISEALKQYEKDITPSLERIERQHETFQKLLADIDIQERSMSSQQRDVKEMIHSTFQELREILDTRECKLISELDHLAQKKIKGLAGQKDQIETSLTQLDSCLHVTMESLRTSSEGDSEVLVKKTSIVQQIEELTALVQPSLNTKVDSIIFSAEDIKTQCENYGYVFMPSLPSPLKCYAAGKGLKGALVGEESTALLQVLNVEGKPCEDPIISLECEIESSVTNTKASCSVAKKGPSQYEINYQPATKGRHQLHIKVEGQHIRGSPFSVSAKSPVEKLGAPIHAIYGVERPNAVAINHRGEMVVTHEGGSVSVLSLNGRKIRSFGTPGSDPSGVAVDEDGNILVADSKNHCIQKFTAKGEEIMIVDVHGLRDVAINPSNSKAYAVDSNCVQVLNSDLTFSSTFGSSNGGFRGIACDSTGKVYVTDADKNCIKVFTAEGTPIMTFRKLNHPVHVALDSSDLVYVTEQGNCRVSVFTCEGEFLTSIGKMGTGPGEFKRPCGVAVESNGVVCVCDVENDCIQLF